MSKVRKPKAQRLSSSLFLIFFGAILIVTPAIWYSSWNHIGLSVPPRAAVSVKSTAKKPQTLIIPKTKTNLRVIESEIVGGQWEVNSNGASHYKYSAVPGAHGNIVIYGHNRINLLGSIKRLSVADEISVITEDNKEHRYKVYKIVTVSPKQVEVLNSTGAEELTVYTCTGVFDSKRLVVKAKPA